MRPVLITGFEPSTRKMSPVWTGRRKQFEIWTLNNDRELWRYADRHFEMHDLEVYTSRAVDDVAPDQDYIDSLHEGLEVPIVYLLHQDPSIPGSRAYPIEDVRKHFGRDYFTNSISYMLALAIMEKAPAIHLYGVDMAREHENAWERPSIEYFLGRAEGCGIDLVIPQESDLLKCLGLYGYVDVYEVEAEMREYQERMRQGERQQRAAADKIYGAIDDVDYWIRRMALPHDQPMTDAFRAKAAVRKKWLLGRAGRHSDAAERVKSYGEDP